VGKKVSVVIPVRDEAGNIHELFRRIPRMGSETEMIFVEGHSKDASEAVIREEIKAHPDSEFYLLKQPGEGKADAVFHGLDHATGDILMILDADLSFEPELLLRFYDALIQDKGDFITGVRLVYPMGESAMPYLNILGNKLFGWVFSIILGQPIRDTLCGTKAFRKSDYKNIRTILKKDALIDPFGDFSLLLGASKINLRICQIPIRYHHRTYGQSKTRPWRDGLKLGRLLIKVLTHPSKKEHVEDD
jgi:glycosyltransferase involved in cell wall biosynthesis